MILSVAMMLDWLADKHLDESARAAGRAIEEAVARVLTAGTRMTRDLGGSSGTSDVGQAVVDAL